MKKRIFALMLALILVLASIAMVACGEDEVPPVDSSSESSSSSSQSSSSSSAPQPSAPNPYDGMEPWFGAID